uniref:Uncharacterized protein n=1 Tax=Arundo donax TaxID=35708 RepID=A0A0A8YFA2_ARUDO
MSFFWANVKRQLFSRTRGVHFFFLALFAWFDYLVCNV